MIETSNSGRTRSAAASALPVAILSAAMTVLLLADVAGAWRTAIALPLVLGGGAALGPLLLLTPVEPSPLKLWLFSALLAPPLVAALATASIFGLGLDPNVGWSIPFGLAAVCALVASRRRIGARGIGRAAWAALAVAATAAVLAVVATWTPGGLHERLASPACVAHMTLAEAIGRGAPLVNPWFAGGVLEIRPAAAAFLAAASEPAGLSPVYALAIVRGWSLLAIAIVGYLAAAAAFRERAATSAGARDVLAAALAVVSLALGPALAALAEGRAPQEAWFEADPAMLLARVYGFAAFLAGLHAVRRGARPWPGVTALLVGVTALLHPWAGASIAVALAGAALCAGRTLLPPLLLGSLLPAFVVGRAYGGFVGDQVARVVGESPGLSWLPIVVLLAPAAAFLQRRTGAPSPGGSRAVARRGWITVALTISVPLAVALAVPPARWDAAELGALVLLPASVVAAGGLAAIARPSVGLGAGLALVGVGLFAAIRSTLELARSDASAVAEAADGLTLTAPAYLSDGLGDALSFIRATDLATRPRVALLRGSSGARSPGDRELPSLAPLLTGVGLWSDVETPPGSGQSRFGAGRAQATGETDLGDRWVDRKELLDALFRREGGWSVRFDRVLKAELERGTTLVFVATEADRRRTTDRGVGPRGTDTVLMRLGAQPVFARDEVVVYVLEGSAGD